MDSIGSAVNPGQADRDSEWELLLACARSRAGALCRGTSIDPDDLAQEALARLLLVYDRVRNRRSWLARVVANLFVSELRRTRVRAGGREGLKAVSVDVATGPTRLDSRLDLRRHARVLSEVERRCLSLYAAGHSHREIATMLGRPVHGIGPCIARALARLRRSLVPPP
jgi:DNA-directed RNA polymerase specialized sigma24 family protein